MTPFSLRDSNQRTACARSVRVNPHVCCQVYKVQVSVSNIVSDATGSRVHTTSIHKYPPSVSCHVPRCSILSQHISPMMRPNELPQNPISINRKMRKKEEKVEQKKERKKTKKCLPCFCSVSCAQGMTFCSTPKGCASHRCHRAKSNVQCTSMACGWCVAQTLLLTRVAKTTSTWRLGALPTAQEVSDQHFENSSYSPFEIHICCGKQLAKQPGSSPTFGSSYELQTIWTESSYKSN